MTIMLPWVLACLSESKLPLGSSPGLVCTLARIVLRVPGVTVALIWSG
jgi:hypothetical protein